MPGPSAIIRYTHRQVVPQLALHHLQGGLCQVELWDGEAWDDIMEVEPKCHQPDVDVYITVGEGRERNNISVL